MHRIFAIGCTLLASLLICETATTQESTPAADTCVIELNTTADATVTIDGREYGKKRTFAFRGLTLGQRYTSELIVRFAGGTIERHTVFVQGGRRIRLAVQSRATRQLQLVLQSGHSDIVNSVAFSPDGRWVLTGSSDGTAILWETATSKKLRTYFHPKSRVKSVAFSPDARQVLTGSDEGTAILWDTITGRKLQAFKGNDDVVAVAFSPDGQQVLTGLDEIAILWKKDSGKKLRTFQGHTSYLRAVAFSPDGRHVLTGSQDRTAILWDSVSGKRLQTYQGHTGLVSSVAFSPDGQKILTGSWDNTFILWNMATGKKLRTVKAHSSLVLAVAFSANGRHVLTGSRDKSAILWDTDSGKEIRTFRAVSSQDTDPFFNLPVAFSPDGRQVLTGSDDNSGVLWDTSNGDKLQTFQGHAETVKSLAIRGDGRALASVSDEAAILWDMSTGKKQRTFQGHPNGVHSIAFGPDGNRVLAGSGEDTAILWDTSSGGKLQTFKGKGNAFFVTSVAYSPDGRQVLTGSVGGRVDEAAVLWDAVTGEKLRTFPHSSHVTFVAFSPDGRQALTGAMDDTNVVAWEISSGKKIRIFQHTGAVRCAAFSPDGRKVLTGAGILWDLTSGEKLRTLQGHTSGLNSIAFSPDGRQVLTGSSDSTAILWETDSGQSLRTFRGHSEGVRSVAFRPNSRQVLTSSSDGIRLWDVDSGDELLRLFNLGEDWLAMTPTGLFDGPVGGRQKVMVRVGRGVDVVPVDRFFQDLYYPGLLAAIWRGERPLPTGQLGANAAPLVQIVSPVADGDVDSARVTIQVEVTDQGGGIKGPWLLHNGARVLAPGESKRGAKGLRRTFSIPLVEGENQLEVHAASEDGSWESEPDRMVLVFQKPLEKPQVYLVGVGVNQYAEETMNLKFAAQDAQAMGRLFAERGPALYGQDKIHVTQLIDSQATKAGIKKALADVAAKAKPQDTLVVFLAGHGTMVGQRYYFVPHEFRSQAEKLDEDIRKQGLAGDELDDWISAVPALKRVVIYDTCQSGGVVGVARLSRDPFVFRKAMEQMSRSQGSFIIAATAATDAAQEVPDLGHGVLTYALLAAMGAVDQGPLKRRPLAVGAQQQTVNVRDWFGFAQDEVPSLTRAYFGQEQFIRFSGSGANFPLLPVGEQKQTQNTDD